MITVNGQKVQPWNPFAPSEPTTNELPLQRFELTVGDVSGTVTPAAIRAARRVTSSARSRNSSGYSGPLNWNRQQGIYIYRADRLVQWGGWNGIRGIDEHTKLARAALDFDTDLDSVFNINVAKMRVTLPPQIRQMLERPINELCCLRRRPVPQGITAPSRNSLRRLPSTSGRSGRQAPRPGAQRCWPGVSGSRDAGRRVRGFPSNPRGAGEQAPEVASALGLD